MKYDIEQFEKLAKQGNSVSFLIHNEAVIGVIAQGDKIKKVREKWFRIYYQEILHQ